MWVISIKRYSYAILTCFDSLRMVQSCAQVFIVDEISHHAFIEVDIDAEPISIVDHLAIL